MRGFSCVFNFKIRHKKLKNRGQKRDFEVKVHTKVHTKFLKKLLII